MSRRAPSRISNELHTYEVPFYLNSKGYVTRTSRIRFQKLVQLTTGLSKYQFDVQVLPDVDNRIMNEGPGPHILRLQGAPKPGVFQFIFYIIPFYQQ
jgi:hypothetical protein